MNLPRTLPARLYLLAYRPERGRMTQSGDLGLMLRAAALTDLLQRGLLRDDRGAAVPGDPKPTRLEDPLLTAVLERIADSRPRTWEHWVKVDSHTASRTVRERLAEDGTLELEQHRVLGLFPTLRPVPVDPEVRERLLAGFSAALTDPLPQVEPWQAALVALADAGRLRHLLSDRQRRGQRARIRELTALTGPVPRALLRAIRARQAAQSGG
jgi:Golgi phosphoprotein 3 (GPP34)